MFCFKVPWRISTFFFGGGGGLKGVRDFGRGVVVVHSAIAPEKSTKQKSAVKNKVRKLFWWGRCPPRDLQETLCFLLQ